MTDRMPTARAAVYVGYGRSISIEVGSPRRALTVEELTESLGRMQDARDATALRRRGMLKLTGDERVRLASLEADLWPAGVRSHA